MADTGRAATVNSVATASVCAFAMIATQVAGKSTRDALFLSSFDVSALPAVLIVSAVFSLMAVLAVTRGMSARGPLRIIPHLFLASAVLLLAECVLAARWPRAAAIVVYLHVSGPGSILISGFWSIVNEHFDPRAARISIGRIVGSATVGGLFGGLLAERVGTYASLIWVLPIIAGIHVMCGVLLVRLKPAAGIQAAKRHEGGREKQPANAGLRVLARASYLRSLALIVLLGNVTATLIDYLFKARAAGNFDSGAELVRFFAVFYTGVSVLTLAVQAGMTSRLLEGIGIANTVAVRPAVAALGGLATLPAMGLLGLVILRTLEAVLQSSLFRSAYELLFTPVLPEQKRNVKTLIDVGADRLGDIVGGTLIRAVIFLPWGAADYVLMMLVVAISGVGFGIARGLRQGYVRALEASLIDRADILELSAVQALPLRSPMMESFAGVDLSMSIDTMALSELRAVVLRSAPAGARAEKRARAEAPASMPVAGPPLDPEIAALMAIRSGEAVRVNTELRRGSPLSAIVVPQVISLLAWDEVTGLAERALAKTAPRITGQLIDHMLDPEEDFAIRRRIPRVLSACTTQRACDGLMTALSDARFEVRYQAGAALVHMHVRTPDLEVDPEKIYAAVLRETRVSQSLWDDPGLIDPAATEDSFAKGANGSGRPQGSYRLKHVFAILSLVLPRTPLQIAHKSLLTDDAVLHGTGLEYLESVLPRDVWNGLQPFLDDRQGKPASLRPRQEILDELMHSRESIDRNLRERGKGVSSQ